MRVTSRQHPEEAVKAQTYSDYADTLASYGFKPTTPHQSQSSNWIRPASKFGVVDRVFLFNDGKFRAYSQGKNIAFGALWELLGCFEQSEQPVQISRESVDVLVEHALDDEWADYSKPYNAPMDVTLASISSERVIQVSRQVAHWTVN